MKTGSVLPCSALALLFLQACGGDKPAAASHNPAQAPQTPAAQTPAAQTPAQPTPAAPAHPAAAAEPAKKIPRPRVDYEMVKRLFGLDPMTAEVDNPSTPEKVALGKALYHEKGLVKADVSCATCHDLSTYGVDNKPKSPGSVRNTPTTLNAFREFSSFWDGRAATVEQGVLEHGFGDEATLVANVKAKPELVAGFQKAFPGAADAVTGKNIGLAIGAFERTLVTKSPFDAYLDGDQRALSNEQLLGLKTFMEVGCITCHTSRLVGGAMFQKSGLLKAYPTEDTGRFLLTKSDADKGFFKVPSLLNVEKTAPYFHDGKVATLDDAVKTMADLQLGRQLKPEEESALIAFLKALTGPLPAGM
ncbi:MAG TPA: cytochrome c peroxidase [Planctomycetota bacterium]|nr:cytochrome c peroxidase [Planctomycetota bacterium]